MCIFVDFGRVLVVKGLETKEKLQWSTFLALIIDQLKPVAAWDSGVRLTSHALDARLPF